MTQIKITDLDYWTGDWSWSVAWAMTMARNYKLVDIGDLIHDSN